MTVRILQVIRRLAGEQMQWLSPPYEYEYDLPPIDILYGSDALRTAIDAGDDGVDLTTCDVEAWRNRTADVRLYH